MKNLNKTITLFLFVVFASCMTDKKLAKTCNEKFPCLTGKSDTVVSYKDTTVFDTVVTERIVMQKDTILKIDTLTGKPIYIEIEKPCKCKDSVIYKDRIREKEVKVKETVKDSAREFICHLTELENEDLKKQVDKWKGKYYSLLWFLILVFVLLGVGVYLNVRKKKNQ